MSFQRSLDAGKSKGLSSFQTRWENNKLHPLPSMDGYSYLKKNVKMRKLVAIYSIFNYSIRFLIIQHSLRDWVFIIFTFIPLMNSYF